ncbi:MAG: hypothetical protein R3A46_19490 [Thermomicrobiales bacterium]
MIAGEGRDPHGSALGTARTDNALVFITEDLVEEGNMRGRNACPSHCVDDIRLAVSEYIVQVDLDSGNFRDAVKFILRLPSPVEKLDRLKAAAEYVRRRQIADAYAKTR